jgi:hypothetical protein
VRGQYETSVSATLPVVDTVTPCLKLPGKHQEPLIASFNTRAVAAVANLYAWRTDKYVGSTEPQLAQLPGYTLQLLLWPRNKVIIRGARRASQAHNTTVFFPESCPLPSFSHRSKLPAEGGVGGRCKLSTIHETGKIKKIGKYRDATSEQHFACCSLAEVPLNSVGSQLRP